MSGPEAITRFAFLQKNFALLKVAFADTPQHDGGIRALSGFAYQMQTALLALLKAWNAQSERFQSNPDLVPLLVEALSDYTELSSSAIVCCQVKRTLGAGTARKALREFWLILDIAKREAPTVVDALRFRIVHRLQGSGDIEKAVAKWAPPGGADDNELMMFKKKVQIRNEHDPERELLALLANHFTSGDPLAQMHEWLGALFTAAETSGDFAPALKGIWSDLRGLENTSHLRQSPGYLWSIEDQPPSTIEAGPVIVGQRAEVRDLRRGYFADRPIFHQLANQAHDWIEKVNSGTDAGRKVNLFWISGRSGTGKSIALLHVLALLHTQENNRIVVWLGSNISALPGCFQWARPLLQDGRQVLIGIDDPFPADREFDLANTLAAARQELSGLQGSQPDFCFPLIICCGPTEQRLGFRTQFGDIATIKAAEIPPEDAKDRAALWDWYQRRTDQPRPQPYTAEQDVLLVQLFFEWQTGQPIGDFALRFQERIRQLDKTPEKSFKRFMDSLFAINRLYVNYPAELFEKDRQPPEFETAFRLLHDEESHLTFDSNANEAGLRITHPHLANAIYESPSWYPSEPYYESHRRSHLEAVISRSLEDCTQPRDKLRVLWAIARIDGETTEEAIQSRLNATTIAALLHNFTEKIRCQYIPLPTYLLPVLVELQARYSSAAFAFSPIQSAFDALNRQAVEETGFRLLCHKVLQHREALERLDAAVTTQAVGAIRSVLEDKPAWVEWPHIALNYRKATADGTIDPWIANWIKLHLGSPRTASFIQDIVEFTQSDAVLEAASSWLATTKTNSAVIPFVLQALLASYRESTSLQLLASTWLDEHDSNQPSWTFVWEALAHAVPPDAPLRERIIATGRTWLDANDQRDRHPSWSGVLAVLIEFEPSDLILRQTGWTWLKATSLDHGTWTFVWEALEETTRQGWEDRSELVSLGRKWLLENAGGASHGAWPGVLTRLIYCLPADVELTEMGRSWLATAPLVSPSWSWLWDAIHRATQGIKWPHHDAFLQDGIKWLKAVPITNPGWTFVWVPIVERAFEGGLDIGGLLQLGRDWFDYYVRYPERQRSGWPNVLAQLISFYPADADLREATWTWLEHAGLDHAMGPPVWGILLETTDDKKWQHRETLVALGQQWFAAHRTDYDAVPWPSIVLRLVRLFPADADLREAAWMWLEHAGLEHGAGPSVWSVLLETTDDKWQHRKTLLALGQQWFAVHHADYDTPPWPSTVLRLVRLFPADADLREAAWTWLEHAGLDHAVGPPFWGVLLETTDDRKWQHRETLVALGQQWFTAHRTDYDAVPWPSIVLRLVRLFPADADLREAAWTWLGHAGLDHGAGPSVWSVLLETTNDKWQHRKTLLALGQQWFAVHRADYDAVPWPSIVLRLVRLFPADADLREAAWTWLGHTGLDHGARAWGALIDTTDDKWRHRETLVALGQQWFAAHRADYDAAPWPSIVLRLVRLFPADTDLREAAWTFLESGEIKEGEGFGLWSALNDTDKSNSDRRNGLRQLGAKWIVLCSFDDPFFGKNWEAVFELGEREAAFLDLGFQWARNRLGEKAPSFILPKLLAIDHRFDFFLTQLVDELKARDGCQHPIEKMMVVLDALERRCETIDDDLFLHGVETSQAAG